MSSFILKIIGIISMFLDHSGYAIFNKFSSFNYIGRLALPIFAFEISEGYLHTKNLKKYFLRLGLLAIMSQIPYYLFFSHFSNTFCLNIFFTLFLGLLTITIYDKLTCKWLGILIVAQVISLCSIIPIEYSWYGVTLIFVFYLFHEHRFVRNIAIILTISVHHFLEYLKVNFDYRYIILWVCTLSSLILINLYNGKKGKDSKYIFYLFYPIHLLILNAIYLLLH